MAEVEYATTAKLPVETIWRFVEDMDNWAPFLTGYLSHEKKGPDDSVWVLKGDVGSLTRTLQFEVHVDEWAGPERVEFSLDGVNEQMSGGGRFLMRRYEEAGAPGDEVPARKTGAFSRAVETILRFFFRLVHGRAARGKGAGGGPGSGMAMLTFELRLDPGGPMAPMINAMMKPAMKVAAEDLANKIIGHLEAERDAAG